MTVAALRRSPAGVTPTLEQARALARRLQPDPAPRDVHRRLPDAGLGVPEAARCGSDPAPSFLLESAEQGRVGRYSFIGFRPRKVLRWSLGDPGDPYALAAAELAGSASRRCPTCRRSPAAPSGCSPTTWSARSSRSASPTPTRSGLPDLALMLTDALVAFDHLKHTVTVIANVYSDDDLEASYDRARETIAEVRWRLAGPVPRPAAPAGARPDGRRRFASNMTREQFEAIVARIIEYIYAGDAFQVVPSQRWSATGARRGVLDLPRPARGQPEPVHVLPGLRRLRDRRREPRAADHGLRPARRRPGRSPARARAAPPPRRTAGSPRSCSPTRRSGPST